MDLTLHKSHKPRQHKWENIIEHVLSWCILNFSQPKATEYGQWTGVLAGLIKEKDRRAIKQIKRERRQHSITWKISFSATYVKKQTKTYTSELIQSYRFGQYRDRFKRYYILPENIVSLFGKLNFLIVRRGMHFINTVSPAKSLGNKVSSTVLAAVFDTSIWISLSLAIYINCNCHYFKIQFYYKEFFLNDFFLENN